jgi:hypothetical protein
MQIENNAGTIYDEPLLTLRMALLRIGTPTNPVLLSKVRTLYSLQWVYDFSTRRCCDTLRSPHYMPRNLIINHDNRDSLAWIQKTPAYQLDVNGYIAFCRKHWGANSARSKHNPGGSTTGSVIGIGHCWKKYLTAAPISWLVLERWDPGRTLTYSVGNSTTVWYNVWQSMERFQTSDAKDKTNIRDLNYGL